MRKDKTTWVSYTEPLLISLLITLFFLLIDYAEKFPFSFSAKFDSFQNIVQNLKGLGWHGWLPSLAVGVYIFSVWMLYISLKNVKAVFLEFIVPLAIVFFTLVSGTIGFLKTGCFNVGDAFFAAANLLTLNTSVFKSFLANDAGKINFWIENARLMGGVFLTYAFVLALSLATGKENLSRIRFRWFRTFHAKKSFSVVIGDGEKAVALALNLVESGTRVAFLHQGFGEYTENIISEKEIWYLKGNASSKTGLEKTYFSLAEKVYVLNDSDEENFRTTQEMEDILKQDQTAHWFVRWIKKIIKTKKKETTAHWFVHLTDLRKKSLLTTFVSRYIQTFDINQNIARRLINEHPINRFENGSMVAQVVVVGFGTLAEAIVMQCLRIGHFTGDKHLQIKVYFSEKDQENVHLFKQTHPELFKNQGIFGTNPLAKAVQDYTFFQHAETIIDFEPLPLAESELINPDFSLYSFIQAQNCVSLYVCLDTGMDNAAFLGTTLPRLAWQKQKDSLNDVQVFCHYNLPDLVEQKTVQDQLNNITKEINTIECFGNYLEECTAENIENEDLDFLAKQIAKLYGKIYDEFKEKNDNNLKIAYAKEVLMNWQTDGFDTTWKKDKEIYRESNRQAADHAQVKFILMNKPQNNLPNTYEELIGFWSDKNLKILGENEHRRWCAEKLLLGWLPIQTHDWSTYKDHYQKQKLHQHLVPFNDLDENEKNKDYTQVLGLPFFMAKLNAKNKTSP
ncbi:MAG: hypothetical protein MUF58_21795 [Arcicella sp.]|jgi:hypothetical protein|nr:hypothetical protein [Arcicella sp.]